MFEDFRAAFLDFDIIRQAAPLLWQGTVRTLLLSALTIPLGLAGGLGLAVMARSPRRWLSRSVAVWVDLFRALPPLVLLILLYAGLPFAGVRLNAWEAVAIAFFLNTGAYYGEVFRAGLNSVPPGQDEAARALGLGRGHVLVLVSLPQAVPNVLPELLSNTLEIVKLTSLASVAALPELLFQARQAQSITYNASPILAAAAIYCIMLWPLVRVLSTLSVKAAARRS